MKNKILLIMATISLLVSCTHNSKKHDVVSEKMLDPITEIKEDIIPEPNYEYLGDREYENEEDVNATEYDKENVEEDDNVEGFEEAYVTRVVDGDTAVVDIDGEEYKLRFIGVDTPETKHPKKPVEYYGMEASNFTKEQLEGKTVYLQKDVSDTDRYGRLLRYIWLEMPNDPDDINDEEIEEKMYNAILVKEGYAVTATFPPDVKYEKLFVELARKAREENKGLWSNPDGEK